MARLILPVPFRRKGYFVRRPASSWLDDISAGLDRFELCATSESFSAVLNSLSLLLMKSGKVDQAAGLCQRHAQFFANSGSLHAVQPWINIGRINLRRRNFHVIAPHFFLRNELILGAALPIAGCTLLLDDPAVLNVCCNVRLIEGAQLSANRDGIDSARIFLSMAEGNYKFVASELLIWLAYFCGDITEQRDATEAFLATTRDFVASVFYSALYHQTAGKQDELMISLYCLLEILHDNDGDNDSMASLLYGFAFLLRADGPRRDLLDHIFAQPILAEQAATLGDAELLAFFSQTSGSIYSLDDGDLVRLATCCERADAALYHCLTTT